MHLRALLLLSVAASAAAQDTAPVTEMKPDAETQAATEMKPDAETQAAEAAAPPGTPARPRPAMMAPLAPSSTLLGITVAGSRLVAVGQRGHILLSDDGRQWRQVEVPVNAMLNRVRFRDDKAGWAVGHDGAIVATTDGGQTWQLQHYDPEGKALYDVLFLDSSIVALGGYGTYLTSSDDGRTWEAQTFPLTELGQHFNAAVKLADGTLLIAGERGLLARSKDGAKSWELLDSPYNGSFFGALPAGDKGALVFGLRGNLYTTADIHSARLVSMAEYDAFTRETVPDEQALAKTGWQPIQRPTTEGLFGGAADGTRALLVGVNGVIVTVDAVQGTAALVKQAPETLNDVTRLRDRWFAVGRRGVQDLGPLATAAAGEQ
jgi:photosystem II stability/assembly factor-like uncharacterized protein